MALVSMLLASALGAEPPRLVFDASRDTSNALGSRPYDFATVGDRLLFVAQPEDGVRTLFATDASGSSPEPLLRPECDTISNVATVRILAVHDGSWALVGIDCLSSTTPTRLWRTDGTAAGTARLAELDGWLEGLPRVLRVDDRIYFLEGDNEPSPQFATAIALWSTDGTPAGTRKEVERADLEEATTFGLTRVRAGFVFFRDPLGGVGPPELWFTDGTDEGTRSVARFEAEPTHRSPVPATGGRVLFVLDDRTLWSTDGTSAGTFELSNAQPGGPEWVRPELLELNRRAYFIAGGSHAELWSTDGTPERTLLEVALPGVSILVADSEPTVERLPGVLLVATASWGDCSRCLVAVDEEDPARGVAIAPLATGAGGRSWLARLGETVLFPLRTVGGGIALGATAGSPESTGTLEELCVGECPYAPGEPTRTPSGWLFTATDAAGGRRLLEVDPDLEPRWRSQPFDELEGAQETTPDAAELDGTLIFGARDAHHGFEPFVSDPGSDAARLLTDLRIDRPDSRIRAFLADGDEAYLQADHDVWQTIDGASSARYLLEPYEEACHFWGGGTPADLSAVAAGALASIGDCEAPAIWALDRASGTVTQLFGPERPDRLPDAAVLGSTSGQALIAAADAEGGQRELWRSDGSEDGTERLLELEAGWGVAWPRSASLGGEPWVHLWRSGGGSAWFAVRADGSLDRVSPWHDRWTDLGGTESYRIQVARPEEESPTFLLYALRSSAESAECLGNQNVTRGVALGERWFGLFEAASGVDVALVTDGSPGGTAELAPCRQGWSPHYSDLTALDGRALYLCRERGGWGPATEIWASDGTVSGTRALALLDPQHVPALNDSWSVAGSRAFLVGNRLLEDGDEDYLQQVVWATDGSPEGTRWVGDFPRAPGPYSPRWPQATPRGLALSAYDPEHGMELWFVDSATLTAHLVADLRPGPESSDPEILGLADSNLFFVADDGLHGRELWVWDTASTELCRARERALCLQQERFRVEAWWQDFEGNFDDAMAVPLTADSGAFWFFDEANVELVSKVLDGRGVDDHFWVFYGALSNVSYAVTVTDGETGATRRYQNPPGRYASVGDPLAFGPLGASATAATQPRELVALVPAADPTATAAPASGACAASTTRLCLLEGRFAVEASWRDFQGNVGVGAATPWTGGETGTFWFFDAANVELIVKVLDGTPVNGRFWVYFGALSNVEYRVTVTDTLTGAVRTYFNPMGTFASVGDVDAF